MLTVRCHDWKFKKKTDSFMYARMMPIQNNNLQQTLNNRLIFLKTTTVDTKTLKLKFELGINWTTD